MEAVAPERRLAGRYELEELIGQGGMAAVWRARDARLARLVAVKILRDHLARDPQFLERFQREAVAAASLTHPCIVSVFDTGVDDATCFIVLEYFEGQSLAQHLASKGPLEATRTAELMLPVLTALGVAHSAGLVHRDVKPANILVGPDHRVKVADFGVAKAAQSGHDLTRTGAILGTVAYLSPEQVQGSEVDARSDVYSAGVVMFELLTGRLPFHAESDVATALMRLTVDPPSPRDLRGGIPRELEAVVLRAMARDPSARFPTAEAMRAAVERAGRLEERTLPRGIPPVVPESAARGRQGPSDFRAWMLVPLVLLAVAVALIAGGLALGRLELGGPLGVRAAPAKGQPLSGGGATRSAAVPVARARDFDPPPGDGSENPEQVALAIDGNPGTAWMTDHYRTADFGGLKHGVGLWVELAQQARTAQVTISSPVPGWSFQLWSSSSPPAGSAPSAGAAGGPLPATDGTTTFTVGPGGKVTVSLTPVVTKGLLIWITGLAPSGGQFGYAAAIAEVSVMGTPT